MFLGIDGGGTKTAFTLIDGEGQVRARHVDGSLYHPEVGLDGVAAVLQRGVQATLQAAACGIDDVAFSFVGMPCHGEDSALQAQLDALPAAVLPAGRYRCGNDMVCGWAGSLGAVDGINIVAGTGSIAYGEWQGRSARAGGWGELFSDEGSAYWIAREGLALFSRMSDGRAEAGPLLALWRDRLQLGDDLDLCAHLYGPKAAGRSGVAGFAPLVVEAAEQGDPAARAIFVAAAAQLVDIIVATARRLGVPANAALSVSYSGGVFQSQALVLDPLRALLAGQLPQARLVTPRFSPSLGAALQAARLAGRPLPAAALARLEPAVP
ncbi:N-acetylglucosamine kinase [Ideonella sp.]|uniref:N-acetylglucosamine kinase n=1 Tax=Ideonella sp. TaxID=1929293 RepID=UPI0035AFE8B9